MKAFTSKRAVPAAAVLAITMTLAGCGGGGGDGYVEPPPPPANTAPGISAITDKISDQDTVVSVEFGVQDAETAPGSLAVTATTDSAALFPADGVVLSGSGATRTLTLTPLESATGTATITLSVADAAGATATRSFQVAINLKSQSMRTTVFDTIAKGENDAVTAINGWTALQDADDPAVFAALIPAGEE